MNNVPNKTCRTCAQPRPLSNFRRRRRNSDARESRCRQCHAASMREYRRKRSAASIHKFAQQVKWRTDPQYLQACCQRMMARFGGADGFARAYYDEYRKLSRSGGCTRESVDLLLALTRILEVDGRT